MIEFALGIHDGARVFPVHAMGWGEPGGRTHLRKESCVWFVCASFWQWAVGDHLCGAVHQTLPHRRTLQRSLLLLFLRSTCESATAISTHACVHTHPGNADSLLANNSSSLAPTTQCIYWRTKYLSLVVTCHGELWPAVNSSRHIYLKRTWLYCMASSAPQHGCQHLSFEAFPRLSDTPESSPNFWTTCKSSLHILERNPTRVIITWKILKRYKVTV